MGPLHRLIAALPLPWGRGEPDPDPAPEGPGARFSARSWRRDDGSSAHLIVCEARDVAVAHALVRAPDGLSFRSGTEVFEGEAILASPDDVLDAMALFPADRRDMTRLRLLPPDPDRLASDVARLLDLLANNPLIRARIRVRAATGPAPLPPRHPSGLVDVIEASDVTGLHALGNDARAPLPAPDPDPAAPPPVELPRALFGRGARTPHGSKVARTAPERLAAALAEALAPWHRAVRADVLPAEAPALVPGLWTAEAYAHYLAPGEAGRRRGQAAALYPGLAPVLATVPALRDLVDAGRPFEDALARTLDGFGMGREGLSRARLRRMRTLPAPLPATGPGGLSELLNVSTGLPLELLPVSAEGWRRLLPGTGATALRLSRRHGLALPDLLRGLRADWGAEAYGEGMFPRLDALAAFSIGVDDMVSFCHQYLVGPCTGLPQAEGEAVAAAILLRGRTLAGVRAAETAWHVRHGAIADTADRPQLAWVPLFAPYRSGPVVLRCLTTTAGLIAEGGKGSDSDGVEGLHHCVGSYDRSCATGYRHVVSVAHEAPGTARLRLSTVELRVDNAEDRLLSVHQHRGPRNGIPPAESEIAVEALLRDVAEGLHPIDPEAAKVRDVFRYEVSDPQQSFDAWRPLMTKAAARAGLPGLAAMAAAVRGGA